jgi:AraC-like DNA-binding protein
MNDEAIIRAIRRVAKRRVRLNQQRREVAAQLRDYVREAHDQGIPISRIAQEAGLSRQGVYDLLDPARSS